MGVLINFIRIFVLIIGGLFAATYLRRVIGEENISPRYGILGGILVGAYFFLSIYSLMFKLSGIEWIEKYSIIPVYIFMHLIIFGGLFFIFTYLMIVPYEMYYLSQDNIIRSLIEKLINKAIIFLNNHSKAEKFLKIINRIMNPFRKIGDSANINLAKWIKTLILISYLISGVILLSYFTNQMEANGAVLDAQSFKRDYELYKTVFVTSLIPFTINYIKDIGKEA